MRIAISPRFAAITLVKSGLLVVRTTPLPAGEEGAAVEWIDRTELEERSPDPQPAGKRTRSMPIVEAMRGAGRAAPCNRASRPFARIVVFRMSISGTEMT